MVFSVRRIADRSLTTGKLRAGSENAAGVQTGQGQLLVSGKNLKSLIVICRFLPLDGGPPGVPAGEFGSGGSNQKFMRKCSLPAWGVSGPV